MKSRLVFLPETSGWRREKLTEDDIIQDFEELTSEGVAMRYSRESVAASLRAAADALEGSLMQDFDRDET